MLGLVAEPLNVRECVISGESGQVYAGGSFQEPGDLRCKIVTKQSSVTNHNGGIVYVTHTVELLVSELIVTEILNKKSSFRVC